MNTNSSTPAHPTITHQANALAEHPRPCRSGTRTPNDRSRRTALAISRLYCCLLLVASATGAFGSEPSSANPPTEAAQKSLEESTLQLTSLRAKIDRGLFEPEALLEALDYDHERIIRFVSDDIVFHRYSGALRGITGTLQSRSGNTLDQSVLLAFLLKGAGLDARIAGGYINRTAYDLAANRRSGKPVNPESIYTNGDKSRTRSSKTPSAELARKARFSEWLDARRRTVNGFAATFQKGLRDTGVRPGPVPGKATDMGARVYWVEYRDGPSSSWEAVYPALAEALEGARATHHYRDSIPEDLHHKISVQVHMERSWGGEYASKPVFAAWKRPAALLSGNDSSINIHFVPDAFLDNADSSTASDKISRASLFLPLVNGKPPADAHAVTIAGDLIPLSEAISNMAGIFKTMSEKLDRAADAMAALGKPPGSLGDPLRHIKRVWIEITAFRPDGLSQTFSRDLAVWRGDRAQFNRDLSREVTITFQTGTVSPAWFADLTLDIVNEMSRAVLARTKNQDTSSASTSTFDSRLRSYESHRFLANYDMSLSTLGLPHVFRDRPTIVARFRSPPYEKESVSGFDIVTSSMATNSADPVLADTYIQAGIIGAIVENAQFGREAPDAKTAAGILLGADARNLAWTVLTDATDPELDKVRRESARRIRGELSSGYAVILARRADSIVDDAWWRVDPGSGEFIAELSSGWGGAETVQDITLRKFLIDLAKTHGPLKVFTATTTCTTLFAAAKIDDLFPTNEATEALGVALEQVLDVDASVCGLIPDEFWATACEAGMAAVAVAAQASKMVSKEAKFGPFVRGCVLFIVT